MEKELLAKVREYGMRCVGPNCLGVLNTDPAVSMDATFAEALPERGHIGFVSQSGALGGGILNILKDLNLGFAQFIQSETKQTLTLKQLLSIGKMKKMLNKFFFIWNQFKIRLILEN